jgi:hypothetical protein
LRTASLRPPTIRYPNPIPCYQARLVQDDVPSPSSQVDSRASEAEGKRTTARFATAVDRTGSALEADTASFPIYLSSVA